MKNQFDLLVKMIGRVRYRWKFKNALRGLAICSAVGFLLFYGAIFLARYLSFNDSAVWTLRILVIVLFALVAAHFLIVPYLRRVSDLQVARFIEENHPELQQRLTSAVECADAMREEGRSFLLRRLTEDALNKSHRIRLAELIRPRTLLTYAGTTLVIFLILVGLLTFGPGYLPYGAARLFAAWTRTAAETPFKVTVRPGNATVQRGSRQDIQAAFEGFSPERAILFVKDRGTPSWNSKELQPARIGGYFGTVLDHLEQDQEYFVEAEGFKSDVYRLQVEDLPRVRQIDLRYEFPAYTGLPVQTLENQGNISALRGTRVRVQALLNMETPQGKLFFNDGKTLDLTAGPASVMSAEFELKAAGTYVIQLVNSHGEWNVASDEHSIEVLEDQPPDVVLTRPGRDYRASRIEEVFVEAKASDDLRIARLELHYSVNGNEEKILPLYQRGPGALKSVTAGHTLFLEEMALKTGDVISYFAQASDGNPALDRQRAASDIFFIEVSSFDKSYSQSQQRGGGGEGQGGGNAGALTGQQKEIIAATWRLIRDQKRMEKGEFAQNARSIALIQGRLKDQATGLARTIGIRMGATGNSEMMKLAKMLQEAGAEMEKAESRLSALDLQGALPHEQAALRKLLEAESFYKEVQVSMSSSGDPGAQAASRWEDLSELFELEMDKLKNQYETLRQEAVQKKDEAVDDALRRLRELAQRQEQFAERQRRMMSQQGGGASSSASRSEQLQRQQELVEQAENLKRRLEQLAREKPEQQMTEASRRLQQAVEEMRKAQQDLRSGQEPGAASASAARALQQLREAERLVNSAQSGRAERSLDQLGERVRELQADEKQIQDEVKKLADQKQTAPEAASQERDLINQRKDLMVEKLDGLEAGLDKTLRELGPQKAETGRALNEARSMIRERRLRDKIVDGKGFVEKGWYDFARAREDSIAKDLEELAGSLSRAKGGLSSGKEEQLQRALDRTRDLVDSLESMNSRMEGEGKPAEPSGQRRAAGEGSEPSADRNQSSDRSASERESSERAGKAGKGQQGQAREAAGERERGQEARAQSLTGGPAPQGGDSRETSPARLTAEQFRQLQREYAERLRQGRGILEELGDSRELSSDLEGILRNMQQLSGNLTVQAQFLERLRRDVLDPLRQFELELSRRLSEQGTRDRLQRIGEGDVPPTFRKSVDEYFKKIAGKD